MSQQKWKLFKENLGTSHQPKLDALNDTCRKGVAHTGSLKTEINTQTVVIVTYFTNHINNTNLTNIHNISELSVTLIALHQNKLFSTSSLYLLLP